MMGLSRSAEMRLTRRRRGHPRSMPRSPVSVLLPRSDPQATKKEMSWSVWLLDYGMRTLVQ